MTKEQWKEFDRQVEMREIPCPHERTHVFGHLRYWRCQSCGEGGEFGLECNHMWQYYPVHGCVVCCNCSVRDNTHTSPLQ